VGRNILPTQVPPEPELKTVKRAGPTMEMPPTEPTLVGRNIHPTEVPINCDLEAKRAYPTL
jgi:hypothetical protein